LKLTSKLANQQTDQLTTVADRMCASGCIPRRQLEAVENDKIRYSTSERSEAFNLDKNKQLETRNKQLYINIGGFIDGYFRKHVKTAVG
ncbi:MAG: hypothetical protein ACQEP7_04695, partial [bacterium]